MKIKKFIIVCNLLISNIIIAQNITNTLGASGLFSIKDGSTTYLSISQSNGYLSLNRSLTLSNTTGSNVGVIYKGADRFMHNYGGENTFLGENSGNFSMSGTENTAVGPTTLYSNTTGAYNCAFGNLSLNQNTQGSSNSAFGYTSLFLNTTGNQNSAFGNQSLYSNTTGNQNSAFGNQSLYFSTTGNRNSAFGYQSLYSNTTGADNTSVGFQSLSQNNGSNNTAIGYRSLFSNQNAVGNTSIGSNSLFSNSDGYSNTAVGYFSLHDNMHGFQNTAIGSFSLTVSFGNRNTAVGSNALVNNFTGERNCAFGVGALGLHVFSGSNNIGIGYDAQVPSGSLSNQVRIGNTDITYAGIQVAWTITSDRKWKENIVTSPLGLKFISRLNPVSYTRINDESHKTEYGLIAQEVEEVLKDEGVNNSAMITVTDEGNYELRYNDLLAPMIKAIQELNDENQKLKLENENLEQRLTKLEEAILKSQSINKVTSSEK